jgi:hypothetical protein
MKKIVLGSAFIFGAFVLSNAQELKITNHNDNTVEYGSVEKGSDGKRTIELKNVGDKPLIISNVQSSCGCTVPKWPTEPIAPGKKAEIVVTYNTSAVGRFTKNITIFSNDVKSPNLLVRIQGTVNAPETSTSAGGN